LHNKIYNSVFEIENSRQTLSLWSASQPQNKPSPNGENQETGRQGNSLEEEDRNQRVLTPSANLLTIDIKEITSGSLESKCKVFR
jgi:hypothetical protein